MVQIKSKRAQDLISRFWEGNFPGDLPMQKFPSESFHLCVGVEMDQGRVKKLSFQGELADWQKSILLSVAKIIEGKPLSNLGQLSFRECEAYLRDRNSEAALEGWGPDDEAFFRRLLSWIEALELEGKGKDYHFSEGKGSFRNLKLTDKVRELKAFLSSPPIISLYRGHPRPELLDVDGLTVFLAVPYHSESEKALLDDLHALGVEAFQEEELNFIPDP